MKKLLLLVFVFTITIALKAQTTRFWKGYGSSDNISDGSNWFNGNPSSDDNMWFDNTGGDCGTTGRRFAYSNYGIGSHFGSLIVYNCAKMIKFYGDNSYFLKIENNNSPDQLEVANGTIGSRTGNNIEINPVGSGGLLISSTTLTIDNTTSSKSIFIYGSGSLTINSAIDDVNGTGGQIQQMAASTVTLGGSSANTYSGNTTTFNGGTLVLNKSAGVKAVGNGLIISSGSTVRTDAANQLGTGTPALITINGNGIFNGNGNAQKIALTSSSSTSSVTMAGGALTIDNTGTDTYSGAITGTSSTLTKSNSGTQILDGINTYTGLTTVTGGILRLNRTGGTTIPVTNNVTINGGTLRISTSQTLNNLTLTTGTLTVDAGVTLTINGSLTITGGTVSNSGTIAYGGAGVLVYSSGGNYTATSLEWPSSSGPNDVTIQTSGTNVSLPGNRTIAGILTLTAGTLSIGSNMLTLNGTFTGPGTLTGSATSNLTIGGTGALGTLNFTQTSDGTTNAIYDMVVNRTSTGTLTLGNKLVILNSYTPTAGVLTITGGVAMHLRSTATKTAQMGIGSTSGGYITGNVTVERYIPSRRAWRILAAPTSGQTFKTAWQENQAAGNTGLAGLGTQITSAYGAVNGFDLQSNGHTLLRYNATNDTWDPAANTTDAIATNSGYLLFIRGDRTVTGTNAATSTTLRTTGTVYQGDRSPVAVSAGKFALIGNVYASAIDFNAITGTDKAVDDNFWVWDPKLGTTGGYQSFTLPSGGTYSVTPGGGSYPSSTYKNIESGQAFFVYRTGGSNGSITLREAHKTSGSREVNRSTTGPVEQLKSKLYALPATTNYLVDGVLNAYDIAYSNAVDRSDAKKLSYLTESIATLRNGTALSVEARQPIAANDTIFFKMAAMRQQEYRFEFTVENLDHPGLTGFLEDSYLGSSTPISLNGVTNVNFTIDANAGSSAVDRFRIVFIASAPVPVPFTSIKAYEQNKHVMVEWKVNNQVNIQQYEVERSTDGGNFSKVATQAATGNSGSEITYNWLDQNPVTGDNYYRVRSIGIGGEIKYSTVVKVTINKGNPVITIYPNPVINRTISVQFADMAKGVYTLRLVNAMGQVVFSQQLTHSGGNGTQTVKLGNNLTKGSYYMEMIKPDNSKTEQALVIEH